MGDPDWAAWAGVKHFCVLAGGYWYQPLIYAAFQSDYRRTRRLRWMRDVIYLLEKVKRAQSSG